MSKFVLLNTRIFAGGVDLTSNTSKVELAASVEDKDVTSFGSSGWNEVLGGLRKAEVTAEGQWEAGDLTKVDDSVWASLGTIGGWTVTPDTANVGDVAYLTQALTSNYTLGGAVGDVAPWSAGAKGSWPVVRGQILHPPGTARTTTGTGTARQLGALSSSQRLYVALHVLSVSGTTPSITVKIQSDDNSGMTTPVDQLTFTAATAISGQVGRVTGAVTDDWWRAQWTISGTTPSFLLVVSAGIGPL